MGDEAHVGLVYAHAESDGGDDHHAIFIDEALLVPRAGLLVEPGVIGQGEVIEHVANGGDALVLMPTGGGKSLCFQIPALMREGCGIVVSPLIALMHDQVAALREAGVKAACLNSTLGAEAAAKVERELLAGRLDLLYVAPERLVTPRFLGLLERARLALFAIDEAHCVSQWGTISGRSTSNSRCSPSAIRRFRASRSPRPPTRPRGAKSSRA